MENENFKQKDTAKEKIILFVIGVLLGAVISTATFFVYTKTLGTDSNSNSSSQQMPSGTPPEMPSSDSGSQNSQGGTPPEKPSDDSSSQSGQTQSSTKSSDSTNSESNNN